MMLKLLKLLIFGWKNNKCSSYKGFIAGRSIRKNFAHDFDDYTLHHYDGKLYNIRQCRNCGYSEVERMIG